MRVQEEALRLHACGFNCAQSVLASLGSYTGAEESLSLALAGGFGGGVRCGEICGAVSGAVMALGLVLPYTNGADAEARAKISKQTMALTRDFVQNYGCIRCQDLKRNGIPCNELIAYAASRAEEMIKEEEKEK